MTVRSMSAPSPAADLSPEAAQLMPTPELLTHVVVQLRAMRVRSSSWH